MSKSIIDHRKIVLPLGALLLLLAIFCTLEWTNTTHFFHQKPVVTSSSYTKGETRNTNNGATQPSTQSTPTSNSNTPQPGDQKSDTGGSFSNGSLVIPTGDFVSNHHPGENGSPLAEVSVCNTTPGATCQIVFVKDGVTKALPVQTTDRGGSTYWNNWTPSNVGLTSGVWSVTAVAKLSGQTKTAPDSLGMVVQ